MSDKELKLLIAGRCLAALLTHPYAFCYNDEEFVFDKLTRRAWKGATKLIELSEKEEKE
jgi:hypothetical protein